MKTKTKQTKALVDNDKTYGYWVIRFLPSFKKEYIESPFVGFDVAKDCALTVLNYAKNKDIPSWHRYNEEVSSATTKAQLLYYFERAAYNAYNYEKNKGGVI